jgi:hypothetical protein
MRGTESCSSGCQRLGFAVIGVNLRSVTCRKKRKEAGQVLPQLVTAECFFLMDSDSVPDEVEVERDQGAGGWERLGPFKRHVRQKTQGFNL